LAKTNDVKEVDKIKIVNYSIWLFYVYNNIIKMTDGCNCFLTFV
jgi:hypothetical protein